jgi:hypothetical protein
VISVADPNGRILSVSRPEHFLSLVAVTTEDLYVVTHLYNAILGGHSEVVTSLYIHVVTNGILGIEFAFMNRSVIVWK